MSDKLISGRDDISGREVIPSKDIRPPEKWKPVAGSVEDWVPPSERGVGMYQTGSPMRQRIPANPDGSKPETVEFPDKWPGVTYTDMGAVFDPTVTVETWKKFGNWAGTMNRRTKLWIGDWMWFNDAAGFGFTLDDMHEISGLEVETLKSYATIGYQVPIANRILGPKPSVYAAVAPLPPHRQLVYLQQVKADGLSRDMLRKLVEPEKKKLREAQIAAGLRPNGRPPKPAPAPSLADDMERAANVVVVPHNPEPDLFETPQEFEGSIAGARAWLAEWPDTARVKIVLLA